jgi:hypothetical protein
MGADTVTSSRVIVIVVAQMGCAEPSSITAAVTISFVQRMTGSFLVVPDRAGRVRSGWLIRV